MMMCVQDLVSSTVDNGNTVSILKLDHNHISLMLNNVEISLT